MIALASLGVSVLFPGVSFSWGMEDLYAKIGNNLSPEQIAVMKQQAAALPLHPFFLSLIQALIAGITINAFFGFGEELGWRGLLQQETARLGFWRSAFLIGLVWGVWHAPIIIQGYNYPQFPVAGLLLMTVWTMLLAPIFSYVRLRAGSVIAAAIIHGSLNASVGLSFMLIKGGNDLLTGEMGLAGFIVLALVNLFIFLSDKQLRAQGG